MQLSSDKNRSKAMQIACVAEGVTSVAIKGDSIEVIGDIDSVKLTKSIRRKVSKHASIESVEAVKPKAEEKKEDTPTQLALAPYIQGYNPHPYYTSYYYY
ncbi:hypothetical protein CsSME_00025949 [Camellia sinensis var. sinensis]|nr:heavy metal-associated isoprenylated plant protein 47-like [Camellia sinensis]